MSNHIMWDLETMGTVSNSVVLSIGMVAFNPNSHEILDKYYSVISYEDCVALGLVTTEATKKWWDGQRRSNSAAAEVIDAANSPEAKSVATVLSEIKDFIIKNKASCMWGNGSDFDNGLVADMYHLSGVDAPWKFWNNRCFRTIKAMFNGIPMAKVGVQHNALADAEQQLIHLFKLAKAYGFELK